MPFHIDPTPDSTGSPVELSVKEQDILLESENRLRLITESAPYAMLMVDERGLILFSNPQVEKTFGYKPEELLNQPVELLIPKNIREEHTKDRKKFHAHPSSRAMGAGRDLFGLRKDGTLVPVEIALTPIKTSKGMRVLASIVDITVRKNLEKGQRRLELEILEATELERKRIGQELHDGLGQQLLGIAFLSDALKQKLHEKFPAEAASAEHIANLIEGVMKQARELSRELYAAELEAHGLYEALKQLAVNMNATTNIRCHFICDHGFVLTDKAQATNLYRIAQEALSNVRRHSQATEVRLLVDCNESEFRLTIKDNGVGLPAEESRNGMGLKTMRYRTDVLGGFLKTGNNEDGGAFITCSVPLKH